MKPGKDKQIDDVTVMDDSFSNLKEKDLEAMLISQQKVLDEINSKGEEQHPVLKAKSSKEHRKRKYSNTVDPVDKLANSDISEGKLSPNCLASFLFQNYISSFHRNMCKIILM